MAKQDKMSKSMQMLQKGNLKGGKKLSDVKTEQIRDFIHTGTYLLNAHLSGSLLQGLPSNKMWTIAGDPKTGKTYLAMNAIKDLQDKGYYVYFFDTENAMDVERMEYHGIDMDRIIVPEELPETVDDILATFIPFTDEMLKDKRNGEELPKVAAVIDSLTSLNSTKQYEDARKGEAKQDMGTLAKDLKRMLNMMVTRAGKLNIPIINTAHVYEKDYGQFKKKTPSGGQAAIFLSSIINLLTKTTEYDEVEKKKKGINVRSEVVESRFSKPIKVSAQILYNEPMNPYHGLDDLVSWETCGVGKGKITDLVDLGGELFKKQVTTKSNMTTKVLTFDEISKHLSKAKSENLRSQIEWHVDNGYMKKADSGGVQFTDKAKKQLDKDGNWTPLEGQVHVPNPNGQNWIAKHLDHSFSKEFMMRGEDNQVFTKEVLQKLDENVVKPKFKLGEVEDDDEEEESENNVEKDFEQEWSGNNG